MTTPAQDFEASLVRIGNESTPEEALNLLTNAFTTLVFALASNDPKFDPSKPIRISGGPGYTVTLAPDGGSPPELPQIH